MKTNKANQLIEVALDSLVEAIERGHSLALKEYLSTMSRFHKYSLHNTLLIALQRPDATHVAGFHTWKKLRRSVNKGESGIAILAPIRYTKDATHDEESEARSDLVTAFRTVYVFDVSQTSGKPLPAPASVVGDSSHYLTKLDKLISDNHITLQYSETLRFDGCSLGGRVIIKSGLPPAKQFSVKVHELAHEFLHRSSDQLSKTQIETEAEAIAFVVSDWIGLNTNTACSDYIQAWSGNKKTLLNSLQRIKETSGRIIDGLG